MHAHTVNPEHELERHFNQAQVHRSQDVKMENLQCIRNAQHTLLATNTAGYLGHEGSIEKMVNLLLQAMVCVCNTAHLKLLLNGAGCLYL